MFLTYVAYYRSGLKAIKDDFISKNYPPSPKNGQEKADIETLLKKQCGMERMMMQGRIARRAQDERYCQVFGLGRKNPLV
jgi:hypothetical protein